MCGIAGLLAPGGFERSSTEALLEAMAAAIVSRGPDDAGVWTDDAGLVGLAHSRLAIVDLSAAGAQPMRSESGRYVIVFNGEIYNFRELRRELEGLGHDFRGHSDTEVLLACMDQWGVSAAVRKAIGMFAFALWDASARTLTLVRDRIGEKPLYYGQIDGQLVFASELKALRALPDWRPDVDRQALTLLLRHNYIPAPFSIYQGIRKLMPGCFLQAGMADGRLKLGTPQPYWSLREPAEREKEQWTFPEAGAAADQLDRLLREVVASQMVADVPLGAFLSGGIDSSTVVAVMQAVADRPVRTFSIGFSEAGYDEAVHAKRVASHLGTEHTELYVSPEQALAVVPRIASIYDEPFSDSSQIPTFLVAQLAQSHVKVALSGDGGDELFGGYNRYFWGRAIWRNIGWAPVSLRRAARALLRAVPPGAWDGAAAAANALLPGRLRQQRVGDKVHKLADVLDVSGPEDMYRRLVSHWQFPDRVVKGAAEPDTILTRRDAWPEIEDFSERMMFLDMATYLPDDILVKVDRAAMGVSLETRIPLLDLRMLEFAARVPLALKINGRQGKWLLRQVLYRYVPPALIERPKMGFGIPLDSWLRGPLKEWAGDLLSSERLRKQGFLEDAPIREKWDEHQSGKRNWQYLLWDVLMFQAWLKEWGGD